MGNAIESSACDCLGSIYIILPSPMIAKLLDQQLAESNRGTIDYVIGDVAIDLARWRLSGSLRFLSFSLVCQKARSFFRWLASPEAESVRTHRLVAEQTSHMPEAPRRRVREIRCDPIRSDSRSPNDLIRSHLDSCVYVRSAAKSNKSPAKTKENRKICWRVHKSHKNLARDKFKLHQRSQVFDSP